MVHRIVLVSLAVIGGVLAGCDKQSAIPESPSDVPQTEVATQGGPKSVAPSSEMAAYNKKFSAILLTRDKAETTFQEELKAIAPKIDENGLSALVPIYSKYAKALDDAADGLKAMTAPPEAAKIQDALVATFKALGDNLDATVGEMHSDGQEDLARLSEARKKIQAEGALNVNNAVTLAKYDLQIFQTQRMLIPAPDSL